MKSSGVGVSRVTIDTNNGEAFCVENGGYVGIGTEDPKQNFHVNGNVQIDGDSASTASLDIDNKEDLSNTAGSEQLLLNLRGDIANDGQLRFKQVRLSNGTNWETSAFRIQRRVDVSDFGYIDFGTGAGAAGRDIQFGAGNGAIMMHLDNTAKVGINTTVPQSRLHVFSGKSGFDYATTGHLIVENNGNSTIQLLSPNTHTSSVHFGDNDNGMVGRIIYEHANNKMSFWNQNNQRMTIDGGNVGIGTVNPLAPVDIYATPIDTATLNTTNCLQLGLWVRAKNPSNTTGNIYTGITLGEGRAGLYAYDDGGGAAHGMGFWTGSNSGVAERLRIMNNGAIAIGTNNAVRGPVHIHQKSDGDVQIHLSNEETGATSSGRGFTIFGGAGTNGRDMGFVNRESNGTIEFYTNNNLSLIHI